MKNTGTNTWTTEQYQLGSQNPQDNTTWGLSRVALPSAVEPGAEVSFDFNITAPSTPGTYNFQWRMVHAEQGTDTWFGQLSDNVAITVNDNEAPEVSITEPANGASYTAPANIIINAVAADSDGTISKVEFFQGSTLLGEDTTAPYSFTWSNVPPGTYSLTAKATDDAGATSTSNPVNVTVIDPAPSVSITSPSEQQTFTAGSSITITASASAISGRTITKVEFFQGTTLLGEDTTAPYEFVWSNVPAGDYTLTAKATDSQGDVGTSPPVHIRVRTPLAITNPTNGAVFTAPATINIQATAPEGTTRVEFFQGTTLLGADTTAPYEFVWSNVPAGSYSLSVKATDGQGTVTPSPAVNVTVVNKSNVTNVAAGAGGATVRASSQYHPDFPATSAIDGDRAGRIWGNGGVWTDGTAGVYEDWLEVTFYGVKTIHEIDVFTVQDQYWAPTEPTESLTFNTYGLIDYEVQYWNGSAWQTVPGGNITGNNKIWRKISFPEVTTDKIRVLTHNARNYFSDIAEVEAYGVAPSSSTSYSTTYRASTDFSTAQGYRNWYYLDSTGQLMTFDAANNWWTGWESGSSCCLVIWSNGQHPGSYTDAIREWRAPRAGSIRITGSAFDASPGGGDGVIVYIKKNGATLWQQTIENGNSAGFSFDLTTSVAAGDQISFVVNRRSVNNWYDSTGFDPTITFTPTTPTLTNLALGKLPIQSSTYDHFMRPYPWRAVDNNVHGNYDMGSVAVTNNEYRPWWQVDLGDLHHIEKIHLWGRGGQISDFYVFVSNVPFASTDLTTTLNQAGVSNYHVTGGQQGATTILSINRSARYVRVQLTGTAPLQLAEVQLWGEQTLPQPNLALNKSATQSSTLYGAAAVAVDGTTSTVTHTDYNNQAWWQVDLGGRQSIQTINLWNRTDCCGDRLSNFYVLVSDQPFASTDLTATLNQAGVSAYYTAGQAGTPSTVVINRTGRYVRVQLAGANYLSLAEVQIWRGPLTSRPNLALNKPATQSSDAWGLTASRANDGNTDGNANNGSISHTDYNYQAWWQVDLGGSQSIQTINVWNRTDCCGEWLSNFYVFVSDQPFTSTDVATTISQAGVSSYYMGPQAGSPSSFSINRTGRYVRVQLASANHLTLAEVQVLQSP
jgi:hypothetical protein